MLSYIVQQVSTYVLNIIMIIVVNIYPAILH